MRPADPFAPKRRGTRTKMLVSAAEVLRERGAAGVTIDAVLARSGAPRGSVYHHFPDGRNQILLDALRYAGDAITAKIEDTVPRGASGVVHDFIEFWEHLLVEGEFTAGCPVVAAAIGSADDELDLVNEAGVILHRWCTALEQAFVTEGFDESESASLAVMSLAALEGAVVLCRSMRSIGPLREVGEQLEFLIEARKFVRRNSPSGKAEKGEDLSSVAGG